MGNKGVTVLLVIITALTMIYLLPGVAFCENSPDDILVIVNKATNISSVPVEDLKDIFLLKKKISTADGKTLIPINASEGSELRNEWRKRVLKMNKAAELMYWKKMQMRSGTKPPKAFPNTLQVVFAVKNTISYIKRADYKQGVAKIVATVKP